MDTTWPLIAKKDMLYVAAVFQQLDVDYVIGHPNKDVHTTDLAEVPIIRMYGVTGCRLCWQGAVA